MRANLHVAAAAILLHALPVVVVVLRAAVVVVLAVLLTVVLLLQLRAKTLLKLKTHQLRPMVVLPVVKATLELLKAMLLQAMLQVNSATADRLLRLVGGSAGPDRQAIRLELLTVHSACHPSIDSE